MSNTDIQILKSIIEAIEKVDSYTIGIQSAEAFDNNTQAFDATLMNFVLIGEMVSKLSEEFKVKYADVDWINIKKFRNIIAHNYFGIDTEEVFQIIRNDLPVLAKRIREMIDE